MAKPILEQLAEGSEQVRAMAKALGKAFRNGSPT